MNPIDLQGQGSKVKVTVDLGLKSNMQMRGDATLASPLFKIISESYMNVYQPEMCH